MKENWKYKKMSDVFDLQMGKTPSRDNSDYWNGSETWVSIGDMGDGKYISSSKEHITNLAINESGIKATPSGCVIMSFKLSVGKVGITTKSLYTNEAIMSFIPKEEYSISNDYIYYYLKGYNWGNTNRAVMGITLNKTSISNGVILIPPLPVQRQIVAELDLLSDIIEKQKQQIAELDKLAQATFYDMFGDPVTNEKGWEVKRLKDCVIEMFLGPFGSALKTDSYVDKNNAYCMIYEQKHAIRKTLDVETHYIDKKKHDSLKRFEVHSGDFIMSCRGTIGEIFRLPNEAPMGIIHPSLMKIRIKEDIFNSTFFLWLLSWIIKNENTNGNCVQMAITAKELGTRTPIVPPLQLQQSFASKIEAIERQKELISNSIKESRKLFDSRMEYWFG